MEQIDHLVRMANQIAENFSFHDDTVDRVADHLQRFWAPSMRRQLYDFHAAGGSGLQPSVQKALERLRDG